MALINNKFNFTLTDDTDSDPVIDQVVNFTDNAGDTYTTTVKKIVAGSADTWTEETETELMDLSGQSKKPNYLVIQCDNPIYIWLGRTPARDGGVPDLIDTTVTPELRIERLMVVSAPASGSTNKIYAINPSRVDGENKTAVITITYIYA